MIIKLLKLIFGKVIGLDQIPKEKRQAFWHGLGWLAVELCKAYATGKGDEMMLKFKKEF